LPDSQDAPGTDLRISNAVCVAVHLKNFFRFCCAVFPCSRNNDIFPMNNPFLMQAFLSKDNHIKKTETSTLLQAVHNTEFGTLIKKLYAKI